MTAHAGRQAPQCGVKPLQAEAEMVPHLLRVPGQPPVDELDHGRADLLRQPRKDPRRGTGYDILGLRARMIADPA